MNQLDELGRIEIPEYIVRALELKPCQNLSICIDEGEQYLLLRITSEAAPCWSSGEEIKKHHAEMCAKPVSEWKYIRKLNEMKMVVLPKAMRNFLNWEEGQVLGLLLVADTIVIKKA